MRKSRVILLVMFSVAQFANHAMAQRWADKTNLSGFFTSRYSQSDDEVHFHGPRGIGINDTGSPQGTKIGLTIHSQVNDWLNVATLLISRAEENGYATHAEWAFASASINDDLTVRTGRIKFPVGLVNEYVDVGVAYPWITPPLLVYSDEINGAQATRDSYTGTSVLWQRGIGDWTFSADGFYGQVDLEEMTVKGTTGVSVRANWEDTIELHGATYRGEMHTDPNGSMGIMNKNNHSASLVGLKVDWENILVYSEYTSVEMDTVSGGVKIGNSEAWYATLGYRFGKFLPHYTFQTWDRDNGNGHDITTLGLNYQFSPWVVLKTEFSTIETDNYTTNPGLFEASPSSDSVSMTSIALDVIF